MAEQKKMVLETLKPGAEISQVEAASEEVKRWLGEEVDVLDMVCDVLKAEGIEYVFHLTAGNTWNIEGHLLEHGIKRVHVRHEQMATFAAEGWARIAGRPGVAVIGPGTGTTNAASGLAQGMSAQSPMVGLIFTDPMWADNMVFAQGISRAYKVYSGITKYTIRVGNPATLVWEVKRAIRAAMTPPTGPVCVEIPADAHEMWYRRGPRSRYLLGFNPVTWSKRSERVRNMPSPQEMERAMKWFMEAEKPAIITGESIVMDGAIPELQEFVQLTGIPTHNRRGSRGAISEYDPLNCYGRARGAVMRRSDRSLVMGLKSQYLELFGYPPFWSDRARYIQAQTCPENTCMALPTEFELIGDTRSMLRQMIESVRAMGIKKPPEKWNDWRNFVRETKEKYDRQSIERTKAQEGKVPLHPDLNGKLMSEFLHEELNDDYYTMIDGFTASTYFSDWQKIKFAPSMLDASDTIGFGQSPGHALAFGLLNNRDKPSIAIMGDGAVGAGGADIETCSRWQIPCVFVHLNNHSVVTGSHYLFPEKFSPSGVPLWDGWYTLPNIHYERMFKEFGCHTEFVQRDVEVKPALKRAFDFVRDKSKPAFVEVFVDPDVLQEIWTTFLFPMSMGSFEWDKLNPTLKDLISDSWEHTLPLVYTWRHPSWAEGVKKWREERGK
jgi:acetolactate synthase-1/2/3 large subunit